MAGPGDYEARKDARIERLRARAGVKRSKAAHMQSELRTKGEHMAGTPILIGHHSERRHRRDLDKMRRQTGKAFELQREAESLDRRAAAAEESTAIDSDDPVAIVKIKARIQALEAQADRFAQLNKLIGRKRKNLSEAELERARARLEDAEVGGNLVSSLLTVDYMGNVGIPGFSLSNKRAEIRRLRKRLETLEAREREPALDETIGEVRIVEEENRLRMFFPGKPPEACRKLLKGAAFKWSPAADAWQRKPSNRATYEARRIAKAFTEHQAELAKTARPSAKIIALPRPAPPSAAAVDEKTKLGGVRVTQDASWTRVYFPFKPSATIRNQLKFWGFRWSRDQGAWQRKPTKQSLQHAREIAQMRAKEIEAMDRPRPTGQLSPAELAALGMMYGLKPAYRAQEFMRYNLDYSPDAKEVVALVERGLVKVDKRGSMRLDKPAALRAMADSPFPEQYRGALGMMRRQFKKETTPAPQPAQRHPALRAKKPKAAKAAKPRARFVVWDHKGVVAGEVRQEPEGTWAATQKGASGWSEGFANRADAVYYVAGSRGTTTKPKAKPAKAAAKPPAFTIHDLGGTETATTGVIPQSDGTFLAMTFTRSKYFKTRKGAERWFARNAPKPKAQAKESVKVAPAKKAKPKPKKPRREAKPYKLIKYKGGVDTWFVERPDGSQAGSISFRPHRRGPWQYKRVMEEPSKQRFGSRHDAADKLLRVTAAEHAELEARDLAAREAGIARRAAEKAAKAIEAELAAPPKKRRAMEGRQALLFGSQLSLFK